ncbi:MAG: thioredoxin domain-containing protein [Methylacidiphilales bacterium]|nr:thioredoxin domain-containing protein [Candidatus Methylacidiphilales bacterium]MDW8348882.1 thioredoxin domain-containing protein [Verrucomicrobiae bacterium]
MTPSSAGLRNRLQNEKSPYLLQHAHNPVAWQPWDEEALLLARKLQLPIFLSIGYSTCHWCHVMARESFEDAETAAILNKYFIPIKVDREERPDLDSIYMAYVQATTGHGGWPMSVFLTPELHPFFGGTYFPPENNPYGRPSFRSILKQIADAWQKHHAEISEKARLATARFIEVTQVTEAISNSVPPLEKTLQLSIRQAQKNFDPLNGGFSSAPKFPRPTLLSFLLTTATHPLASASQPSALEMADRTLTSIIKGGIHDHLGGGFHRYSVDSYWHIPHYEKMLYDQGQLLTALAQAYALTQKKSYLQSAEKLIYYLQSRLKSCCGAFYSAEDADSPRPENPQKHGEGAYYTWFEKEIREVLDPLEAEIAILRFGIRPEGNAPIESDPHGELKNLNTLRISASIDHLVSQYNLPVEEVEQILARAEKKLLLKRETRPHPHLDDKIITAWNAYVISGLCAWADFEPSLAPTALPLARAAAEFILEELLDQESGLLYRSYRQGRSSIRAFAIDYAALIAALLDLYHSTAEPAWLRQALSLQTQMDSLFWDEKQGSFFNEDGRDPSLLYRTHGDEDHAEPSANSVAALNLIRIADILHNPKRREQASRILCRQSSILEKFPFASPHLTTALIHYHTEPTNIVIVGERSHPQTIELFTEAKRHFLPALTVLLVDGEANSDFLVKHTPWIIDFKIIDGKATAYVCRHFSCQKVIHTISELRESLAAGVTK